MSCSRLSGDLSRVSDWREEVVRGSRDRGLDDPEERRGKRRGEEEGEGEEDKRVRRRVVPEETQETLQGSTGEIMMCAPRKPGRGVEDYRPDDTR